jgi:hypothetical protein
MKTETGTITYKGIELNITYEYTPYEPFTLYDVDGGIGYPSEGGELYILKVEICGVDIYELLSEDTITDIEEMYKQKNEL